jgi:microcystin-dependent protein
MRRIALFTLFAGLLASFGSPTARAQTEPFVGQILIVPFNFAPKGFAFCNGQILLISQNVALFSLLGTTYGGDGRTTFALPDLQGRVPIGMGQGPGLSTYNLGQKGGEEFVTLTLAQIPSHSHIPMAGASPANSGSPAGNYWSMPRVLLYSSTAPDTAMNPAALGMTGGGQPHENRKPFLVMNYIIALQGIYPARS